MNGLEARLAGVEASLVGVEAQLGALRTSIEDRIDGLKATIDFGDRSVVQITRLIENNLQNEAQKASVLEARVVDVEKDVDALAVQLRDWRSRARGLTVGIGIGAAVAGGGVGAAVASILRGVVSG